MEACPHIRYAFQNDKLLLQQASVGRLTLVNKTTILLRPMKTTTVDLGLYARPPEGHGLMLWGSTSRPVTSHVGIIDPGYTGELRLILQNPRRYNSTLRPSELKIHLAAFRYATPQMEEDKGPINHPQYPGDVGLDVSLPKDLALFPHQTVSVTLTVPPPFIPHHRPTIFGRSGLAMQGILVKPCRWRRSGVDVSLTNFSDQTVFLNKYRRFCQLVYLHKHHLTSFYSPHSDAGVLGPRSLFRWASCAFEEVPGLAMGDSGLSEALEGRQGRGFGSSGQ